MSKSKIVDELVKATGAPEQKKDESNQDFLVRLHNAVTKMCDDGKKGDEAWEALGDASQRWYNKATGPLDKKKELPLPAGMAEEAAKKEAAEEEAEDKPSKKKSKKAAKEGKAEKPAKAAKEAKGKKAKKGKKDKGDKKSKKSKGRPRLDDDAVLVRKVKTLPEGNRNKYWDKVPAGTTFGKIRKNKTHFRVVRYWRRNGFVELKAA
jgi:colicin import membrane protein